MPGARPAAGRGAVFPVGGETTAAGVVAARGMGERLGIDWDYLSWLALDASAAVLGEQAEQRGVIDLEISVEEMRRLVESH